MESNQKLIFDTAYVFEHFIAKKGGINKGCKYIAKLLGYKWVWKHIYNVYKGAKPSETLRKKLIELIKPPRPRYRKIIEANTPKQLDQWNTLTADQLREALDDKVRGALWKHTNI